jgi:hypothetical protein
MNPFLEPAKRHKKVRISAAALNTTGIKAEKRMVCIGFVCVPALECDKIKSTKCKKVSINSLFYNSPVASKGMYNNGSRNILGVTAKGTYHMRSRLLQ